jgi:hypothetical protein
MDRTTKSRLATLLRQAQVLLGMAPQSTHSSPLPEVFTSICRLVFDGPSFCDLWDEPLLTQLSWLFQVKPPAAAAFGDKVAELHQRADHVRQVNDVFFLILARDATIEELWQSLSTLMPVDAAIRRCLQSLDRLQTLRATEVPPSAKISASLDFLSEDVGLDLAHQETIKGCLDALKAREAAGVVNALLVTTGNNSALVIPRHVNVQPGNGQIHTGVAGSDDFAATLTRSRLALLARGFLREGDDVICTLDLTEPTTSGPRSVLRPL